MSDCSPPTWRPAFWAPTWRCRCRTGSWTWGPGRESGCANTGTGRDPERSEYLQIFSTQNVLFTLIVQRGEIKKIKLVKPKYRGPINQPNCQGAHSLAVKAWINLSPTLVLSQSDNKWFITCRYLAASVETFREMLTRVHPGYQRLWRQYLHFYCLNWLCWHPVTTD